jgi:carboxypeptidase family protein/TonB-dependent receptor-like protein
MRLRTFAFLVAALLILASGGVVWSQSVQGVITGTITDPTGAVVPNATVTITNVGTNISQSTTTGSDGSYRFPLVPPGNYTIEVKAANFATVRATGIVVEASQTIPFNRQLELAKAQQVIEVTEQVALVQTATSDVSTQVDRATIENAALPDRDVFAVLPFLAPQATRGLDGNPTVGGTREAGTSYLLNGGDNNDNFSAGAINVHPPLESVQDFSILTNDMSAEYGRSAGAVVTVNQKAGGNRYHGAAYEYNRNDLLNANDFFTNREGLGRPKYVRNQFGGEIDGPIVKDKTFFSFAYDRIKLIAGAAAAQTFVPTTAGLQYVKDHGGVIANAIIAARPPVTSDAACPGTAFTGAGMDYWGNGIVPNPVGCLSFVDPKSDTETGYFGRVDHNFSSKDRLSFAANIFRQSFVDKFGGTAVSSTANALTTLGPIHSATTNHWHNLTLDETHSFSPRIVNEVTLAHNRHFNVFVEGNGVKDTIPNILIDNQTGGCLLFSIGGDAEGGQVVGFVQDRWGIADSLTWTVGKHSLKFGGGGQYGILYRNWDLGLPGQYEFGELTTIDPSTGAIVTPETDPSNGNTRQPDGTIAGLSDPTQANFAGDYPYFQETAVDPATGARANAYRHYTYHDYNWFVQDSWKVTPRLTLNLGVRWERYGAPSEDHNILAQFTNLGCSLLNAACISGLRVGPVSRMWPTYNKDYAPRVGFAWDPFGKGKMAIRGGYGISYDRIFDNIWSNGAWNPPFYALLDFDATGADSIFYTNPASIGTAYNPAGPCGPIPYAPGVPPGCTLAQKAVSVRTMDQRMKDSSSQNFYFGIERQTFGQLLFRAFYQGALGSHLPMLENYNRVDGQAYYKNMVELATDPTATPVPNTLLSNIRPNPLYTGFNYRANAVSSNYNALVLEAQKRMSHGLQFQTGYTFSKLLDVNSELFAGCSTVGAQTAPYYFINNGQHRRTYGRAAFDARHAYKFNVIYEVPFLKSQKGFAGHALGGWTIASFFQFYSGHPIDLFNGRGRIRARSFTPFGQIEPNGTTCTSQSFTLPVSEGPGGTPIKGCRVTILDQNGVPFNIGGDYNMDGVANDHPNLVGSLTYSGKSPADGIFTDTTRMACSEAGVPDFVNLEASSTACVFGVTNPDGSVTAVPWNNPAFANPDYPTSATPFERFGDLGRDVFVGPRFIQLDMSVSKTFKITETMNLKLSLQAQNLANHPSFDCVDSNLSSSTFGRAQCLAQSGAGGQSLSGLGLPTSRIMSIGLRFAF